MAPKEKKLTWRVEMIKKEKGKQINDSGIALNRPTQQAKSSADVYTFKKLNT